MMDAGIERLVGLRVSDVMTKDVVTVTAEQSVIEVARIFAKNEITAAPVIDQNGVCVGMISVCDFVLKAKLDSDAGTAIGTARSLLSSGEAGGEGSQADGDHAIQSIGSLMTQGVQTADGGGSLVAAARMMCTAHLHHLPVIDEVGHPVGILSTLDVVAAMVNSVDEFKDGMRP